MLIRPNADDEPSESMLAGRRQGEGRLGRQQFLTFCSGKPVVLKIEIATWACKDRRVPSPGCRGGARRQGTLLLLVTSLVELFEF